MRAFCDELLLRVEDAGADFASGDLAAALAACATLHERAVTPRGMQTFSARLDFFSKYGDVAACSNGLRTREGYRVLVFVFADPPCLLRHFPIEILSNRNLIFVCRRVFK